MSLKHIGAGLAALVALLLAFAWYDGGYEPLREMVEPVPLPADMATGDEG